MLRKRVSESEEGRGCEGRVHRLRESDEEEKRCERAGLEEEKGCERDGFGEERGVRRWGWRLERRGV